MKKTMILYALLISSLAHAGPWDLNIQQYDAGGFGLINRLVTQPGSSVPGILVYDTSTSPALPKLATVDSSLTMSGLVIGVSSSTLAGKFNTPTGNTAQYLRGDGSLATFPTINSGTVTSVGLTSSNLTVTGSPVTTSGTLTVALPNTGTAGTYSGVTTDAQGRVTSGTATTQSAQARALNSAFQINATRGAMVFYSVRIATTASIGGNQDGEVVLEIASDSGFTTNVQTLSISQNAQALTLAITLQSVQTSTGVVSGYVPAGYYARLRTVSTTGAPVFTYRNGQEVLM